jgi:hypothetical protein
MTTLDSSLRISLLNDGRTLFIVSNHGETMDIALETANKMPDVQATEVDDQLMDGYVSSGATDPADANEMGDHGPFKYRVIPTAGINGEAFAHEFRDRVQQALSNRGINAAVMVEP